VKAQVKKFVRFAESTRDKIRYTRHYTKVHSNFDLDSHIREAGHWLGRAQDAGNDRGVSYGARFGGAFLESYPETTGYIIPTFIRLADFYDDPSYLQRAIQAGEWEISVQMPTGAVMAGRTSASPQPAVFNTGQVLLGWAALVKRTGQVQFREAGVRAAEWMLSQQERDGNWIRGNSPFANPTSTLYNVKAAWGMAEFGRAAAIPKYIEAASHHADYTLAHQRPNGWFENCCLTDPARPLLHTIAYTMQGLVGLGRITGRSDLISAAATTADALFRLMGPDGFVPGRITSDFGGAVSWCCLTGSAQTSIVWAALDQLTGNSKYMEAHQRVNRYLMARHDISSPDSTIRGGLAGSWPVSGEYGQYMVLNWATKFLLDALLDEVTLTNTTHSKTAS